MLGIEPEYALGLKIQDDEEEKNPKGVKIKEEEKKKPRKVK